jgi:hypothetical protein
MSHIAAGANYPSDVKARLTLGHKVGAPAIATGPNLWAETNPRLPTQWVCGQDAPLPQTIAGGSVRCHLYDSEAREALGAAS